MKFSSTTKCSIAELEQWITVKIYILHCVKTIRCPIFFLSIQSKSNLLFNQWNRYTWKQKIPILLTGVEPSTKEENKPEVLLAPTAWSFPILLPLLTAHIYSVHVPSKTAHKSSAKQTPITVFKMSHSLKGAIPLASILMQFPHFNFLNLWETINTKYDWSMQKHRIVKWRIRKLTHQF